MKLFMPRCEEESYVKIQHAVQHLWGVNILRYKDKYYYMGLRIRLKQTNKFLCTLMRDIDMIHYTEISRKTFKIFEN